MVFGRKINHKNPQKILMNFEYGLSISHPKRTAIIAKSELTHMKLKLFKKISIKGFSAEAQNRTEIACSSDRCLDQLGYLGKNRNLY